MENFGCVEWKYELLIGIMHLDIVEILPFQSISHDLLCCPASFHWHGKLYDILIPAINLNHDDDSAISELYILIVLFTHSLFQFTNFVVL